MRIEDKAEEVVWGIEEKVYYRTNFNSTRFEQEDKNRGKYIRSHNKRSTINRVWR